MRIASEVLPDLFLAVANSVWQAALVAALVWAALKFAKRINAATRYAIWWAVLGVVLALPAAPRVMAWWGSWDRTSKAVVVNRTAPARVTVPLIEDQPAMVTLNTERSARWPLWIGGLWAALCAYRLWQIGRSYFYLRGVKGRARLAPGTLAGRPLEAALTLPEAASKRKTRLLLSRDVGSPMAVGFLHPAVILPEDLPEELAQPEMEHVLLHESAHIARRDDWSNLLAKLLGAALALHPVAWWILRQIEREREIACDDWVVARVGSARPYAESLARMSELRWARQAKLSATHGKTQGEALASGMFGGGSRLGERIELLLERGREFSPRASRARVAIGGAMLLGCLIAGAMLPKTVAFAQEPKFDVASVKPSGPQEDVIGMFAYPGGRLTATNYTLRNLIREAFTLEDFQILGGPKWAGEDRYSIVAQPPVGSASSKINPNNPKLPPPEEELSMLRALLAERFHLMAHEEVKDGPVYELVVGSKGPKLTEAADKNDFPVVAHGPTDNPERPTLRRGINASMPLLAADLSRTLKRPVLDKTGLKGTYDFKFDHEVHPDGSILSNAIEVLGLKLRPARGPIRYLVIDGAEKPDAN
jgi:uncharacterized protein (TIGR03435 family)